MYFQAYLICLHARVGQVCDWGVQFVQLLYFFPLCKRTFLTHTLYTHNGCRIQARS